LHVSVLGQAAPPSWHTGTQTPWVGTVEDVPRQYDVPGQADVVAVGSQPAKHSGWVKKVMQVWPAAQLPCARPPSVGSPVQLSPMPPLFTVKVGSAQSGEPVVPPDEPAPELEDALLAVVRCTPVLPDEPVLAVLAVVPVLPVLPVLPALLELAVVRPVEPLADALLAVVRCTPVVPELELAAVVVPDELELLGAATQKPALA
jgi:hypothetical protein